MMGALKSSRPGGLRQMSVEAEVETAKRSTLGGSGGASGPDAGNDWSFMMK